MDRPGSFAVSLDTASWRARQLQGHGDRLRRLAKHQLRGRPDQHPPLRGHAPSATRGPVTAPMPAQGIGRRMHSSAWPRSCELPLASLLPATARLPPDGGTPPPVTGQSAPPRSTLVSSASWTPFLQWSARGKQASRGGCGQLGHSVASSRSSQRGPNGGRPSVAPAAIYADRFAGDVGLGGIGEAVPQRLLGGPLGGRSWLTPAAARHVLGDDRRQVHLAAERVAHGPQRRRVGRRAPQPQRHGAGYVHGVAAGETDRAGIGGGEATDLTVGARLLTDDRARTRARACRHRLRLVDTIERTGQAADDWVTLDGAVGSAEHQVVGAAVTQGARQIEPAVRAGVRAGEVSTAAG